MGEPLRDFADILIIRAGPAGCLSAIGALAERPDLKVHLIDKEAVPGHKVGEILLTHTIIVLERCGILPEIVEASKKLGWARKYGFAFIHGDDRRPWDVPNSSPFCTASPYPELCIESDGRPFTFMVPRHEFDQVLRDIAMSRGATFSCETVKDVGFAGENHDSIVKVITEQNGESKARRARYYIDASGQATITARRTGGRNPLRPKPMSARYSYFTDLDFDKAIEHGFYRDGSNIIKYGEGWIWIARLKPGLVSVGLVSDNWQQGFYDKLRHLPEYDLFGFGRYDIVDCYGNPVPSDHHYRFPDYSYESRTCFGSNWNSVGDAARFLDPLLSQGVTLALNFGDLYGRMIGQNIDMSGGERLQYLKALNDAYTAEVNVLHYVINLWYEPEENQHDGAWANAASVMRKKLGKDIFTDIDSLRWIANMENIDLLLEDIDERKVIDALLNQ